LSRQSALDLLAPRASEKGIDLAYQIENTVPTTLYGDATRLRQILVNLLSNAVKFTTVGEVLVAVAAQLGADGRHTVQIAVRDTGIGIPANRIDRLFRAFSQADASTTRQYGGTGLGLAISKRLSELMGGTMWVASVPGSGSTFQFSFVASAAASSPRIYLRGAVPQLTGKRLLIVDDNATNRRILTLQAESWGMVVQTAESGAEALDRLRCGAAFDLAVLDMQMPGMDGVQLAMAIRAQRSARQLPLILLTSLGRRAEDVGSGIFAAYLSKPTKASQLYDALSGDGRLYQQAHAHRGISRRAGTCDAAHPHGSERGGDARYRAGSRRVGAPACRSWGRQPYADRRVDRYLPRGHAAVTHRASDRPGRRCSKRRGARGPHAQID
jgi:CheY-like chemotaxis protein